MAERSPLLRVGLEEPEPLRLSTFVGVVVPTLLSMGSVVLLLRLGFVIGQSGLYETLGMLVVAYAIISMTVLSVCAISTNGALDAGGVYYMISRALGPEFGGAIGIMFFMANVCGSGLYVLALVEAIVDDFGIPPGQSMGTAVQALPRSYWYEFLYGTILLLFCLLVCLVGTSVYSKATFLIFLIVVVVLGSIFISFFAMKKKAVSLIIAEDNTTRLLNGSFTGFKFSTLENNLKRDLKNPSYSIPRGTISAVIFTYVVYNLLSFLTSCTCDRTLLQNDYGFLRDINIWHPFVTIGIYSSTLSAAMSNLIGASRILYALAKDDLFGKFLVPAKKTSHGRNPWAAVVISWFVVQLVLFSGKLNTIATIVTIFFLLVYATVNLACLALEWASAPNFRPAFRYFTWYTCVLGIVGCGLMMFFINPVYATASIAFLLVLLLALHYTSPSSSWGYISQALIFHQVRKYLLLLDVRKDHVKFWRPQMLLMVSNPRTCMRLISFVNDLKKSGLFVLGHVEVEDLDVLPSDPLQMQYNSWLQLVDVLNVKAFVNLTLSDSVRHGVQQLLLISGLGGMRPNTIVLGFYDSRVPLDCVGEDLTFINSESQRFLSNDRIPQFSFPPVRRGASPKRLSPREYVSIISDAIKMLKNVVLARYFSDFNKTQVFRHSGKGVYIDVWPANLMYPDSTSLVDICSLFLLQMASVLTTVRSWKRAKLRVFLCMKVDGRLEGQEAKLKRLLQDLRIKAAIHTVMWDSVVALLGHKQIPTGTAVEEAPPNSINNSNQISEEYLRAVNQMILHQNLAYTPAVRFLYLPRPPANQGLYINYLRRLNVMTSGLGPTLLIHGMSAVTSTEL
uniref:Solute carrier family 12 member 9 n=1 Tax=Geotrypetes seraphini TaxID=260995 RepID=A0A6P8SAI3_GEOSA|nr:solute carrier family 12 member 9-like isoform X2 [Geotrypetes seraphini]